MIRHKAFKHGWFYHYRLHEDKTRCLCCEQLDPLHRYLHRLLEHGCPDEKFSVGPRCSSLRFPLKADIHPARGHEVCALARTASTRLSSAHSNVELALIERDAKTVAVEVPLWLDPEEHELMRVFDEPASKASGVRNAVTAPGPLSGHIDVLRVEGGNVWVWDYKPNARKEKHAAVQTYLYALMLATRTGIPLPAFRCGWFDEEDAFVFAPQQKAWKL